MTDDPYFDVEGVIVGWMISDEGDEDSVAVVKVTKGPPGLMFCLRWLGNDTYLIDSPQDPNMMIVGDPVQFSTNMREQNEYSQFFYDDNRQGSQLGGACLES